MSLKTLPNCLKHIVILESNQVEGSGLIQLDKYGTFISQTVGKDDIGSIQYKDNEMRQRHIKTIQMEMRSSRESGT